MGHPGGEQHRPAGLRVLGPLRGGESGATDSGFGAVPGAPSLRWIPRRGPSWRAATPTIPRWLTTSRPASARCWPSPSATTSWPKPSGSRCPTRPPRRRQPRRRAGQQYHGRQHLLDLVAHPSEDHVVELRQAAAPSRLLRSQHHPAQPAQLLPHPGAGLLDRRAGSPPSSVTRSSTAVSCFIPPMVPRNPGRAIAAESQLVLPLREGSKTGSGVSIDREPELYHLSTRQPPLRAPA